MISDLHHLTWPERSAEVLRFTGLRIEHWLSRGGWLREWIRLNLWVAVILTVAAVQALDRSVLVSTSLLTYPATQWFPNVAAKAWGQYLALHGGRPESCPSPGCI